MKSKLKLYFRERLVLLLFVCMVFENSKSSWNVWAATWENWETKGRNWNVNVIVFAFVASCYSTRTRVQHFMHFSSLSSCESRSDEFTTPGAAWSWCFMCFSSADEKKAGELTRKLTSAWFIARQTLLCWNEHGFTILALPLSILESQVLNVQPF